jgi:phosphosulfolactate synthase (CoM biosynthesis protein A)
MIKTSSGTVYYTQQELTQRVNEIMEDGYRITNAIYEEAQERDWCEQYDSWAEDVNTTLKFFEIPLMRREYSVTYTITRTQEAQVTVTVTATNEDAAEDCANDIYSETDLADKVDEYEWETQDITIDSTEVGEV